MARKSIIVEHPSIEQVNFYLRAWDEQENYVLQEHALDKLFFQTYPLNTDINDILVKASSLNDFYSTNIFSIFTVIYDSFVDKVLKYFRRVDGFCAFSDDELKNYPRFIEILNSFQRFYKLEDVNKKDLDRYLWQLGKRCFPRNY